MLQISERQMSAFERDQRARFVARAAAHARNFDPDGFGRLAAGAQYAAIEAMLASCARFDIAGEAATILFIEARCMMGDGFPDRPEHDWALRLLETERTDETRTLQYVRDCAYEKATMAHA